MSNVNSKDILEKPTSVQDELLAVQLRKDRLTLAREEREETRRQEEESQRKKVQMSGAEAMAKRQKEQENMQANCAHIKPNFQPSIGGQRDHQNDYHWICLYCGKEWTNNELPSHLRIDMTMVGGPVR